MEPSSHDVVRARLADARAAWPGISVDEEAFVAHAVTAAETTGGALAHLGDLYLAFACARGDEAALGAFERTFAREIPAALSRLRADAAFVDEIGQVVREKLFVGTSPKIAEYTGRGSLVSWLRAVVVRAALDEKRRASVRPGAAGGDDDPLVAIADGRADPELEAIRARYAGAFREAFRDALALLTPEERNVLRLHLAEGLNIEKIGAVYQVHRATVARWIARARERVLEDTRRLLAERLRLDPSELDSLTRLCRSRLDVSLGGLAG